MTPVDIWDAIVYISKDMDIMLNIPLHAEDDQLLLLDLVREMTGKIKELDKYTSTKGQRLIFKSE